MAEAIKMANGVHLPEEKLCIWLVQLLIALEYLHMNHILHRDVKCSNIFLTKDHDIRLGDFGLAKMLSSDELASSIVGTPSYMCPELLADIPYGSKSDVWSLGCCMYEMTSLKPAFKAFDMQALINKINKSIVAPLPAKYSGSFRGLVKSMLRRNPELRPSAAALLWHQHLQPYVLNVHLKLNSPRRTSFPSEWAETEKDNTRSIRFSESSRGPPPAYSKRRSSCGNDRTVNPNVSGAEPSYDSFTRITETTNPSNLHPRTKELFSGSTHERTVITKTVTSKISTKQKDTETKASSVSKRKSKLSKNNELLQASKSVVKRPVSTTRRASLPLPGKGADHCRRVPSLGPLEIIGSIKSPDVSVNSPRIDKMFELPLGSYVGSLGIRRSSFTSRYPQGDRSIMKNRYTIEFLDKSGRLSFNNWQGVRSTLHNDKQDGSESSDHNATAGASSRTSSDQRPRRIDMSSYRQRAEALEGLLEFSARLFQEAKIEELGVLIRPFGPGKASPRETAIWLSKSFKENTLLPEDLCHRSSLHV
ncbi:serine/threonine-protein kinase Nek1-like [Salvia splendens]|uniref:serine/threonine-protein kinase Nek1-like n=1 Tax=Salvia splendens TaxID=180675 RepID=UPI001C2531A6|nr:serine/threonine-protein kinase Nek1-like [Salvia splendens]